MSEVVHILQVYRGMVECPISSSYQSWDNRRCNVSRHQKLCTHYTVLRLSSSYSICTTPLASNVSLTFKHTNNTLRMILPYLSQQRYVLFEQKDEPKLQSAVSKNQQSIHRTKIRFIFLFSLFQYWKNIPRRLRNRTSFSKNSFAATIESI